MEVVQANRFPNREPKRKAGSGERRKNGFFRSLERKQQPMRGGE
jgi:hypothetical protein